MSRPVLILFAHPALEKSRVNVRLADAVRDLPGVTFHDLYQHYPDLDVDVEEEQRLLLDHDAVVMQHPFYWYSSPAILKEWQDLVLQHGWAYGSDGNALHGKLLLNATTAGGGADAYCRQGHNRYTMREFLVPFERTAALCGMRYLAPFVVHGTFGLSDEAVAAHAADYRRLIEALRDGEVDLDAAAACERLNADLPALLPERKGS